MKKVFLAAAMLLALGTMPLQAQTLQSVKVEPASARPGEVVTLTAAFDISQGLNCNVRVQWGDGAKEEVRINKQAEATLTRQHSYAQPGSYSVKVEPKTNMPVLKCLGKAQQAMITVAAAAVPAVAAAASGPKAAGPTCPAGWTADAKAANKKTGAFGCKGKPGTVAPADKLACPGSLGYYENLKTGHIGCRP